MDKDKTLRQLQLVRLQGLAIDLIRDAANRSCRQFDFEVLVGTRVLASATKNGQVFQVQMSAEQGVAIELSEALNQWLGHPVGVTRYDEYAIFLWPRNAWKEALKLISPSAYQELRDEVGR